MMCEILTILNSLDRYCNSSVFSLFFQPMLVNLLDYQFFN